MKITLSAFLVSDDIFINGEQSDIIARQDSSVLFTLWLSLCQEPTRPTDVWHEAPGSGFISCVFSLSRARALAHDRNSPLKSRSRAGAGLRNLSRLLKPPLERLSFR